MPAVKEILRRMRSWLWLILSFFSDKGISESKLSLVTLQWSRETPGIDQTRVDHSESLGVILQCAWDLDVAIRDYVQNNIQAI